LFVVNDAGLRLWFRQVYVDSDSLPSTRTVRAVQQTSGPGSKRPRRRSDKQREKAARKAARRAAQ
jgi:hypothetical protein